MPFVAKYSLKDDNRINANEPARDITIKGMIKCVDGNGTALGAKLVFDSSDIVRQCVDKRLTNHSITDIITGIAALG